MSLVTLAVTNTIGWYQDDTLPIVMIVKTSAGATYDITDCSFSVEVYEPGNVSQILFSLSSGSGISPLSAVDGTATVSLSTVQSNALRAGASYPFKVVMTDAAGYIVTTSTGTIVSR